METNISKDAARLLAKMICGKVRTLKQADLAAFVELEQAGLVSNVRGTYRPNDKAREFVASGASRRILLG